ncbi:MAG: hypothetical protein NUV69_03380 [Candidatus Curtissbacteria bacterium]|nr:hypothetical protein [Candidatus Curtissbacteria bacterium]
MTESSLNRISIFLKKESPLLLLGLASLFITSVFLFNLLGKPSDDEVKWLGKVTPGKTTEEELRQAVGEPIKIEQQNGKTIYVYPTTNENRQTTVEIENDKVQLIEEPVIAKEKGSLNGYIAKFGQPEALIYGQHGFAAPGHFWGSKGVIVFGNPISSLIVEIWHFPTTNLATFLQQHPELRTEPSHEDL